ncbi:hypothetical protein [Ammoniphilus sp. CFH 90114]|nr:hypothetical protein [Ammoniphilus sp. CFH 90114]
MNSDLEEAKRLKVVNDDVKRGLFIALALSSVILPIAYYFYLYK